MTEYRSILFLDTQEGEAAEAAQQPDFFTDLNLDQVVEAVTAGYDRYELKPLFYQPLLTVDAIAYRQEVFQDLEDEAFFARITAFSEAMSNVRTELSQSSAMRNARQGQRTFVEAATTYVKAVSTFAVDLMEAQISSRGLLSVRDLVTDYASSTEFVTLREDVRTMREDLDRVRYRMEVNGYRVTVSRPEGETDYSADVRACFERFRQDDVNDHRLTDVSNKQLSHLEIQILEFVVRLFPETFVSLASFCDTHRDFLDDALVSFDREFHFYASYLGYLASIRAAGLAFNYPTMNAESKRIEVKRAFDLALADKLVLDGVPVVCNDVSLKRDERILVVTGPNQGGKSTFARMFGQLHYLGSLGLPVPGKSARLFLFDELYTHFEKEEDISTLVGKLEEELVRVRAILDRATPKSIIILNEMFTSTTLDDAIVLGTHVLQRIIALDALCVSVTFIDEFASLSSSTVSMMSNVDQKDATRRTFKIIRKPADGFAYSTAIAHKHRLGYASLKERLGS